MPQVHDEGELSRVLRLEGLENHLVGINNRNLETFEVDLGNTTRIMNSPAGLQVSILHGVPSLIFAEYPMMTSVSVSVSVNWLVSSQAKERGILMVGESGIFGPEDVEVMHQVIL